jgi:anti-sigma factor RsiW
MTPSDEERLVAYVDGELSEEEARQVESILVHDAEAQALVDAMRNTAVWLRAACNERHYSDGLDRLRQAVAASPMRSRWWSSQYRMLAAASAFSVLGFAGGYYTMELGDRGQAVVAEDGFDHVAEEIASYHQVYARETDHLDEVHTTHKAELEPRLGSRRKSQCHVR